MAQLMPLPLNVSCFSKIQIGFTFLVPAHLGSPGKRAVKRGVCVCVCVAGSMKQSCIHLTRYTHTQPFNGLWSGTTRVGLYQKKHSPTHTHPGHRTSFIIFHWQLSHSVRYCEKNHIHTHTHTHTHPFNGPFSGTTRGSRYQKGKTNLDFTVARDSEWQWHQLGHMQVCTVTPRQITTPAPHHSVFYRPDALPAAQPTASKHWRHIH